MKKILFLDDDHDRHSAFKKNNIGVLDIVPVYTAKQAINALNSEVFDIVSLDHDLGGRDSERALPAVDSGYDVAIHISCMPEDKRPTLVIVHSWNPPGAFRMIYVLKDKVKYVVRSPFNTIGPLGIFK